MGINLDQRSKKAVKLGVIGIILIFLVMFLLEWIGSWRMLRQFIAESKQKLEALSAQEAKLAALRVRVPVVEIPLKDRDKQYFAFRKELESQLRAANIQVKPIAVSDQAKSPSAKYKYLYLKCSGTGSFQNVLNLLVELKKNPYLVGIEELTITKPTTTTTPGGMGGQTSAAAGGFSGPVTGSGPTGMPSGPGGRTSDTVNIELKVSTFVKR